MVQAGKLYKVFGNRVMRVVKVNEKFIFTVHPNGMIPRRAGDYAHPIEWAKYFVEIK